jgi:hypothetical protein
MRSTFARHFTPALAFVCLISTAAGDEPQEPASAAKEGSRDAGPNDAASAKVQAQTEGAVSPAKKAVQDTKSSATDSPVTSTATTSANDPGAVRAQTKERLKALTPAADKPDSAQAKALREVLEQRLQWLDDWDKEEKALNEAEHPEKTPEHLAGQLKADLERLRAALDQAAKDPLSLLPESFRKSSEAITSKLLAEMKDALDAAKDEFAQATTDLESVHSSADQKSNSAIAALRAERDKIHQLCTTLPARRTEHEAALASADTGDAHELAQESLTTFEWEARVDEARLKAKEAQIALETKLADLAEPQLQFREARRELAKRTLDMLQTQYRTLVDRQQADLQRAAAHEEVRAAETNDPLERFCARQNAELLDLETRALKDEHAQQTNPEFSREVQMLADRAQRDLASLKQLVEAGRAGALVALRLKNDYRRLEFERANVARTDLARASGEIARYENMLTAVELDLVNGARDERFALDGLLEALPPVRRAEAIRLAEAHEAKHRALLLRRRAALEKLADRAQEIHQQVLRRLKTLDDQYAYVRTHIFWMRDEEPMGPSTLEPVPREFRRLARSVFRIAAETGDRSNWGMMSVPFALLFFTAAVLPWPLHRFRVFLGRRLAGEHGSRQHETA